MSAVDGVDGLAEQILRRRPEGSAICIDEKIERRHFQRLNEKRAGMQRGTKEIALERPFVIV